MKTIPDADIPGDERARSELEQYRNALYGIAVCATRCGCCEMHREIARQVLDRFPASR